jgi:hypothetical protein
MGSPGQASDPVVWPAATMHASLARAKRHQIERFDRDTRHLILESQRVGPEAGSPMAIRRCRTTRERPANRPGIRPLARLQERGTR